MTKDNSMTEAFGESMNFALPDQNPKSNFDNPDPEA